MIDSRRERRTFGPVVLLGLALGALTAVAASQVWFRGSGDAGGLAVTQAVKGSDAAPLALALALVVLASWGVVLVTRRAVRRLAVALGLLAALGILVTVTVAAPDAHDIVARALRNKGVTEVSAWHRTGWLVISGAGALLQVLSLAVGLRFVGRWPTMAARYDAPGAASAAPRTEAPTDDRELWKALDEGRDPTERLGP